MISFRVGNHIEATVSIRFAAMDKKAVSNQRAVGTDWNFIVGRSALIHILLTAMGGHKEMAIHSLQTQQEFEEQMPS